MPGLFYWIPAFAGMTAKGELFQLVIPAQAGSLFLIELALMGADTVVCRIANTQVSGRLLNTVLFG